MFPVINRIEQVQKVIKGRDEYKIYDKGDHLSVDYVFTSPDTFRGDTLEETSLLRECRGLKFYPDGDIMARPLHKFFNLGERGAEIPEHSGYWMEKRDGSLVHSAMVGDGLRLMTRAGITDVSEQAEKEAFTGAARALCESAEDAGQTACFEFTSPTNRIVVKYDKPQLTLLAVRCTKTGVYMTSAALKNLGQSFGVPVVQVYSNEDSLEKYLEYVRALDDSEGVVWACEDTGERVKVKADAYVMRHKLKSGVNTERSLLKTIVENNLDDVLPMFSVEDQGEMTDKQIEFWNWFNEMVVVMTWHVNCANIHECRKGKAGQIMRNVPKFLHSCAFQYIDGKGTFRDLALEKISKACDDNKKFQELKELMNV